MDRDVEVIVIGAGLAGLAAALLLRQAGLSPQVLEAGDRPGGRVATDHVDGFMLDRGFQVLQTWYPEAQRQLDYPALDLRPFYPGALIWQAGRFHRVSDIWRHPEKLPEMLTSPIGTFADKLRLMRLRQRALRGDLDDLYRRRETTALDLLRQLGFSEGIIESFFKPFFSGVFFSPELDVSSRAFEFVFRAFARGDTALPAGGMDQIPRQLAERLAPETIRYGHRVMSVEPNGAIRLETGERLSAEAVIIATDAGEAARLLGREQVSTLGTSCLYFAAPRAPFAGPYLVLNGGGLGPINSLLSPSNLSRAYAPSGQSLIAINCFGTERDPDALENAVRRQLHDWYGEAVDDWRRLAVYRIPRALPTQHPPVRALDPNNALDTIRVGNRLWLCGELAAPPSIHWALASGRIAASSVVKALHTTRRPAL